MGKLARLYNSSKISSSVLEVLMTTGCADIAIALAQNGSAHQVTQLHQAAVRAAAGHWQDAMQTALDAHKKAIYYPRSAHAWRAALFCLLRAQRCSSLQCTLCRSPPKGSSLWKRLVTLGRTALAYGQINSARECWQAAGHWEQLLPLCALQGDFSSLRAFATTASSPVLAVLTDAVQYEMVRKNFERCLCLQASPEAAAAGEQLLASTEAAFSRFSVVGAHSLQGEWRVTPELSNGSLAAATADVCLYLPREHDAPMMRSRAYNSNEVFTIPPLGDGVLEVDGYPHSSESLHSIAMQSGDRKRFT